jgi:HAD superfamily hydrolase (TIGR01549 family)
MNEKTVRNKEKNTTYVKLYIKELKIMQQKRWEIDCIIYDCDGVLFDSLEANGRLYNHIATSMGRSPLTNEEHRYCHTHTVFESIRYMFPNDEAQERRAVDFLKKEIDFKDFIKYLKMEPNLLETLNILKNMGKKRAISTNRTTSMKYIMEKFNLSPYFDMVVTALDVAKPKPDPESVEKILKELKVKRDRVLYVGDSEVDKGTALSSGVRFIAYKNRILEADALIEDHLALLDYLSDGQRPRV